MPSDMDYTAVEFRVQPLEPFREILLGHLSGTAFEGFEETENGLRAYIPKDQFDPSILEAIALLSDDSVDVRYEVSEIPEQNWNATWEADFAPIEVNAECRVRAPFHTDHAVPYELIILPKMSFGTGHHETTWLMLRQMFEIPIAGKRVLDMGTGTGVLAILAHKRCAKSVIAIDNDEWAYLNAIENVALNDAVEIAVEKGTAAQLKDRTFQVILANINKNVLLHDMAQYAACLEPGGRLLLSGFFESDVPDLLRKAMAHGLQEVDRGVKHHWAVLELQKNGAV